MSDLSKLFLRKQGYSEQDIDYYYQNLNKLREFIHPNKKLSSSEEHYIRIKDGNLVFYQVWKPDSINKMEKIIICQHGHNVHGDLFYPFADHFSNNSLIISIDNRGHGRSGPRLGDYYDYYKSIEMFEFFIRKYKNSYPELPIFLIGESLGSALILHYLSKNFHSKKFINGAILISTPIKLSIVDSIKKIYHSILLILSFLNVISNNSVFIKWPQDYDNPSYLDEFNKYDREDILKRKFISMRSIKTLLKVLVPLKSILYKIFKPILILQGTGDRILDPDGSRILYHRVRSHNKKMVFFKNANHSLFMDKNSQDIYSIIEKWINSLF